jgi:hypothetical protein
MKSVYGLVDPNKRSVKTPTVVKMIEVTAKSPN